ncbi:MAG: NAD-dependent epimerase/dehydratase family protein [Solirubrobacteraceae bacterium]
MKRVLVTGAAGFVGSHLCEECLARGWDVVGVDALTDYYNPRLKRANLEAALADERFTFVEGRIEELDLPALLDGTNLVFHLAAQPGVRASWGESFDIYTAANVTAWQRLLEAAKGANNAKIVFASSSSVYGDAEVLPTREDSRLQPVSPYGATKALGEHLAHVYWRSFGVPIVTMRYFTVYGPRQRPDMAFHRIIAAALTGGVIRVFGDGRQTRDFTFVRDAVTATIEAGLVGQPGRVFNVGGGTRAALNDVLAIVEDEVGPLRRERHPPQLGDARDTAADTTRARAELGFAPSVSLVEGIGLQVEWHRRTLELLSAA